MKKHEERHGQTWLVVDGYNVIGAWPSLKEKETMADARETLCHLLLNHCGATNQTMVLVFDAMGTDTSLSIEKLIQGTDHCIVFTNKDQTADEFIERFVRDHAKDRMTVVSSDRLIQIMIFSHALRMSAGELKNAIDQSQRELTRSMGKKVKNRLDERIDETVARQLEAWRLADLVGAQEETKKDKNNLFSKKFKKKEEFNQQRYQAKTKEKKRTKKTKQSAQKKGDGHGKSKK